MREVKIVATSLINMEYYKAWKEKRTKILNALEQTCSFKTKRFGEVVTERMCLITCLETVQNGKSNT